MPADLAQCVGWAALLGVAATLVTITTGLLSFVRDRRFGLWSDAASVMQMAAMLPLPAGFCEMTARDRPVFGHGSRGRRVRWTARGWCSAGSARAAGGLL